MPHSVAIHRRRGDDRSQGLANRGVDHGGTRVALDGTRVAIGWQSGGTRWHSMALDGTRVALDGTRRLLPLTRRHSARRQGTPAEEPKERRGEG